MYAKIFAQIYDGTLCTQGPWEALVTFQQMLVLADQDGTVDMTVEAIARRTTIPLEIIAKGIAALQLPDSKSRTPTEDGRRIIPLSTGRDWGWYIVNYAHYRKLKREEDRREYHRNYWNKKRSPKTVSTDSTQLKALNTTQTTQTTQPNQPIAYAEAKAVNTATQPDGFELFYQAYPKKAAKTAAAKAFKSAKVDGNIELVLADIRNRIASGEWKLDQKQFIPNPASYLNGRRWEDESGTVETSAPWTGAR
jgi:hypothetical protein